MKVRDARREGKKMKVRDARREGYTSTVLNHR